MELFRGQPLVGSEALLGVLLGLGEELGGHIGELAEEGGVAVFALDEGLIIGLRGLGIEGELLLGGGIEPIGLPVAGLDGAGDLQLGLVHLDAVVDAGRVGDDEGRAVIGFGLGQGLEHLGGIGHGDLGDVDIAVGHGHHAEILLLGALAGGRELGDCGVGGGLGGLSAGVGVHLGIEDQNIDILALGQDVIQSAVADVIGPAVAAEDPEGLLGQQIGVGQDGLAGIAAGVLDGVQQLRAGGLGAFRVIHVVQPRLSGGLHGVGMFGIEQGLHVVSQLGAALCQAQVHAEAELGVVLEQGVGPGGTMALFVDGVGAGGGGAAIDGGAAGGVGNDHSAAS